MFREFAVYMLTPLFLCMCISALPVLWTPLLYASALFGVGLLCVSIGYAVISFLPNPFVEPKGKAVLITGCDSGFGQGFARRLADKGYQVFAGCLFPDGEGAELLRKSNPGKIHIFELDVTKKDHFEKAFKYVQDNLGQNELWAVVPNAGIFLCFEYEWWKVEDAEKMFDVNVYGVMRTVNTFLPMLRKSKGRIVIMASYAGRTTSSWTNVYSMTKHAVVAMGDGLRRELFKWGISVSSVEPTYYKTAILPTTDAILRKWKEIPDDMKETYGGENYVKTMAKISQKVMGAMARSDTNEVIDSMEHAACSMYPKQCYKCDGFIMWLVVTAITSLPSVLGDAFDYLVYTRPGAAHISSLKSSFNVQKDIFSRIQGEN